MNKKYLISNAYLLANIKAKYRNLKVVFIVVFVLMPSGLVIDFIYDGENLIYHAAFRLVSLFLIILLFLYYLYKSNVADVTRIEYSLVIIMVVFFTVVISFTGGVISPHIPGYYLLIFGGSFILAQRAIDTIITSFIIIASFLLVYIYSSDKTDLYHDAFYSGLFYIMVFSVLAVTSSYYNEKWRIKQFTLGYDLDIKNKKISDMSEIKSNLFDSISYEFRHPITLIKSALDDITENPRVGSTTNISIIDKNVDRLLHLVDNISSIIKIEENKSLDLKPIDVIAVLKSSIGNIRSIISTSNIVLHYNNDSNNSIFINGNYYAIEKILTNLLIKSINISLPDGVISIEVVVSESIVNILIINENVSTDSYSIDTIDKDINRGFDKRNSKLSLSLPLIKEFSELMKGEIKVNNDNNNIIFTASFPFNDEYHLENINPGQSYNNANHIKPKLEVETKNPVLLIIEDDIDLLHYLTRSLESTFQVVQATDIKPAMEFIRSSPPDIVLTDWMLPRVDGVHICQMIKSDPLLSNIKVVILSSWVDEKSEKKALQAGADDFIIKPFSKAVLKIRLNSLQHNLMLQQKMSTKNNQLVKIVEDLKSTKTQLIHSEKINAIGSLASGLLHEINNPLNYSLAAIQLLQRDTEIDNDYIEVVDDIYDGMLRIKQIIQDLHTFAHPDKSSKTLPFNLKEVIQSAIRFNGHDLYNINVSVDVDESIIVLGSESQILQVIINLISNSVIALKDNSDGEIIIKAFSCKNKIMIVFIDNGPGIDKDILTRIFEPFFTTKEVGKGLGMGLSISHTIIENHNSVLKVESELGKYTQFSFKLLSCNNYS